MIFLQQKYKQKPKQWGPFSAVQSSVFENVGNVLGIEADKIMAMHILWERSGSTAYDYAGIHHGVLVSEAHYQGDGVVFRGDSYLDNISTANQKHATEFSIISGVNIASWTAGSDAYRHICSRGNVFNNDTNYAFGIRSGTRADRRRFFLFARAGSTLLGGETTNTDDSAVNALPAGENGVLAGTWKSGSQKIYANGKLFQQVGVSTQTPGNLATGMMIGGPNNLVSSALYFNGTVNFNYIFSTALTEDQAATVSDNPYGLFQPRRFVFYSVPASSGGGLLPINETGQGADSVSVIVSAAVADAGAGADDFGGMDASVQVTDAGAGSDSVNPLISVSILDTAGAVDAVSQILSSLMVPDTGNALDDIAQVIASLMLSDTGAATDNVSLLSDILKTVTDAGTGSDDINSPVISLSVSDTSVAVDLIAAVAASLSVEDAGVASDLINTIKDHLVQIQDTGTGADAVSMSVSLTVSDVATAMDALGQVLSSINISDAGAASEAIAATNFDLLPTGKVKITFTMKVPGVSFSMKKPGVDFTLN